MTPRDGVARRHPGGGVLLRWLVRAGWLGGCTLLLLAVVGHWRYTSVGWEFEVITGDVMREDMVRVRWPGDGSVRVGSGWFHRPADSKRLEPFDLGAVFFRPPPPADAPANAWNRWGFWRVTRASPPDVPLLSRSGESWWGVPGWLPGVLVLAVTTWLSRRARRVRPDVSDSTVRPELVAG